MSGLIAPHGGTLIDRVVADADRASVAGSAEALPKLTLNTREASDLEMIGIGGFSPLTGFLGKADYASVVDRMHLDNGVPWTIPVTLSVDKDEADAVGKAGGAALYSEAGVLLGVLSDPEAYAYDKKHEAEKVFLTTEDAHPGVKSLYGQKDLLIGGSEEVLECAEREVFPDEELPPVKSRAAFDAAGWKTNFAFQTRNPIHRAPEYIIKTAP